MLAKAGRMDGTVDRSKEYRIASCAHQHVHVRTSAHITACRRKRQDDRLKEYRFASCAHQNIQIKVLIGALVTTAAMQKEAQ